MAMDVTTWMDAEVQITPADLFRALPVDPKDDGYSQSPIGHFEYVANVVIYAHRWLKRAHSLDEYYRQQLEVDLAELSTERLPPFDDDEPLNRSPKRKLELPEYYQHLLEIDRTEAAIGQLPPWEEPKDVASKKMALPKKQVGSGSYDSTMTAFEFELEAINLY